MNSRIVVVSTRNLEALNLSFNPFDISLEEGDREAGRTVMKNILFFWGEGLNSGSYRVVEKRWFYYQLPISWEIDNSVGLILIESVWSW